MNALRMRLGEHLRCSNPGCRLQVMVTDVGTGKAPEAVLRCSCGSAMKKSYERPRVTKMKLVRHASTTA